MIYLILSRPKWSFLFLGRVLFTMLQRPSCDALANEIESRVRRPDPSSSSLLPVDSDHIKPGNIYNHFSQRQGRYVWAYAMKGGGFSYALGMDSTELPGNFDLVTSRRQTQELVEAEAGPWAKRSQRDGKQIMVRLGVDEKWKVVRGRSIRSHFDIDSGHRWEWHGNRKVAILNTQGQLWGHDGKKYVSSSP